MKFLRFIFSLLFLKHLGIALGLALVAIVSTLIWLNLYTHHGKSYPVPDFRGLSLEEVVDLADRNRVECHVIDSVFTDQVRRGTVFEQNPPPGFHVKRNRKVFLTMNTVFPDSVEMPDLLGMSRRQARTVLENNSLKLGRLRFLPDYAIDNVLGQRFEGKSIEPGTPVQKGAVIDLDLGKGLSDEKTQVPDLIGLRFRTAEQKIFNASLNLGAMSFDPTVIDFKDSNDAFVWKQVPEYELDARINLGTPVYLWLTLDSLRLPTADTTAYFEP